MCRVYHERYKCSIVNLYDRSHTLESLSSYFQEFVFAAAVLDEIESISVSVTRITPWKGLLCMDGRCMQRHQFSVDSDSQIGNVCKHLCFSYSQC